MRTKVIFRKWIDGDIIAIFPEIPATLNPYECQSYMHVGQHSACEPMGVIQRTNLATPTEYCQLARELRKRGYRLEIRKRYQYAFLNVRKAELDSLSKRLDKTAHTS